jgi:hypothetical protein
MGVAVAGRLHAMDTRRVRTATFTITIAASAIVAAALSDAAPTGLRSLDELYVAALAGVVAFFAGSGRRWTWFVPAGVGALVAADQLTLAFAGAAIVVGLWSVLTDTRTRARGALVAGLGIAALMRTESVGFHGATALLTAAAVVPVIYSGYRLAPRRVRRRARKVALIAVGTGGLMLVGLAVGVFTVSEDLYKGMDLIEQGIVAAHDADDDATALRLGEATRHLASATDSLDAWFVRPARALPFVGQNLRAVEQLAEDTSGVARVSAQAATAADVDALQFADGRLDPQLIDNILVPMEAVRAAMEDTQSTVGAVRSPWLLDMIDSRIDQLEQQVDDNLPDLDNALGAVRIGRGLLGGEDGPRRYLVLFTTPVEARGRSGFPGNYAELVADNGDLSMPVFGRITELDNQGVPRAERTIADPSNAEYMSRYGRFLPATSWRNITASADLPSIANLVRELYPQSGGSEIDGVLVVDPVGLAGLMEFTGPIRPGEAEGLDFVLDEGNTAQFLHFDQYVQFPDRSQRVDFLEDVAEITFDRLTTETDMPSPRQAIDVLGPAANAGHIQFVTFDEEEVEYFDDIGISGRLAAGANDVTALVTTNAVGNKIDYYMRRSLRYEVDWDPASGTVTARTVVQLRNEAPPEGLPDYIIGNGIGLPPGYNRSFVSVYSPYDLEAARIDGQPVALQSEREVGLNVYSRFVEIPPQATLTLELDLTGNLVGPAYGVGVLPQPTVEPDEVDVTVNVAGDRAAEAIGDGASLDGSALRWSGPLTDKVEILVVTDAYPGLSDDTG